MKLLILNTFFLLFFHAILTAQSTQKEHYIGAFYMTDTRSTPDGGCLVAGLSDGDSIHVRRLNANLKPIFNATFLYSIQSLCGIRAARYYPLV